MKQNFEESNTCIIHAWSREQYLSHRGLYRCLSDCAATLSFYSRQGIAMDNINLNKISVIDI
jgi:hypothetical protein